MQFGNATYLDDYTLNQMLIEIQNTQQQKSDNESENYEEEGTDNDNDLQFLINLKLLCLFIEEIRSLNETLKSEAFSFHDDVKIQERHGPTITTTASSFTINECESSGDDLEKGDKTKCMCLL
ncbi:unnamed protein product [Didymodactylos carnosus]|uniref:Uncharacterized protein n=1 Tax=Didymodactylos carnosus TaxID=1234261 RepID=A0A815IR34_9BILA|nr:unnamed protein product [Didymodactylos carnosus]CAF4254297.1 unnamed protein product [Didymodactylos carnosus]